MKQLHLKQSYLQAIIRGKTAELLLVGDDQDITVDDQIELVDDENQQAIGTLLVNQVTIKRLADFANPDDALVNLQGKYKPAPGTPAKKLSFTFTAYVQKRPLADIDVNSITPVTEVKLYGDGGSRGNPGPAASGWVVYDMNDTQLKENGLHLGITTNNQAEYTALKMGLIDAHELGAKRVNVFMDSLLVINQLKGIYKVKNKDLWPIYDAIKKYCVNFEKVTFTHVPRALNSEADRMVNETLDAQQG